jgi:uncharacterized membrane protein
MWLIPMAYTIASLAAGLVLPRLEQAYLSEFTHAMSVSSALAFFATVSSGMMALTGIVFAIAFVVVQFGTLAYSPRLVVMFASSRMQFHALGIFSATFAYSLVALAWTDRGGSGTVPLFSTVLVILLLVASMLAFARLIESINGLQIHNVLRVIGGRGRSVIHAMFPDIIAGGNGGQPDGTTVSSDLAPPTQTLTYSGEPRVIAKFDISALVSLAEKAGAVVVLECAVGDTLLEHAVLLRVHGTALPLARPALMHTIHLSSIRTFEQDPKYAVRLLVDIAIRALSPAVNDPTTAVQALDQIEDLLRRLGRCELDAGRAYDANGVLRVIVPMPTWGDFLVLSFDEIRHYGASSVQVVRRLRSALIGLSESVATEERRDAVLGYLAHLDIGIGRSGFDDRDRITALQEDRQGLGLARRTAERQRAPIDAACLRELPKQA